MRITRSVCLLTIAFTAAACGGDKHARCGDGVVQAPEQCDDGNSAGGDGCEANCTPTPTGRPGPTIVECAHASDPPLTSGTCAVTAGSTAQLFTGTVLQPGRVLHGGQVLVDGDGVIQCVDCDCGSAAAAAGATTIACPTGVISPGLVNPHDHITYDHHTPTPDTGERFEQRNDWRLGLRGHSENSPDGKNTPALVQWSELRQVMGGTTSLIGSGSAPGFLRNLDVAKNQEGLPKPEVDNDTFPLDTKSQLDSGCGYGGFPNLASLGGDLAYQAHVAEGIDAVARNEFLCLSGAPGGELVTMPKTSFVHAVGLLPADYAEMAKTGTALVWSPRSNVSLYGDTARVTVAARSGVLIALGTDWTPSGSIDLQRELACADSLNKTYFAGFFNDQDLWLMATRNAAASVDFDDLVGVLEPGAVGDLAVFDGATNKDFRAIIDGSSKDVVLVERGGKALYGDQAVVDALGAGCDPVDVCGAPKSVCVTAETGMSYSDLAAANTNSYPAFFCGTPDGEPTCTPKRPMSVNGSTVYDGSITADDMDGDGIANSADNCATVFNPIRPLDNGTQADADGDGVGDACDPCPSDAAAMSCAVVDPFDVDGDGVADKGDNCPTMANADQKDSDADGKGDACDACPMDNNGGSEACWQTIYDIKSKPELQNQLVGIRNALVTALVMDKASTAQKPLIDGFYVQVKPGDAGYVDENNSGLYVYTGSRAPGDITVGSRVDVNPGTVTTYYGEIELTGGEPVVKNPGAPELPVPAPVMVPASDVTTGGPRASALEGVLVQIADATVTDVMPAAGAGDKDPTNEFVAGGIRVDDLFYLATPFPVVDDNFKSIAGVLVFRNGNSKIEPRNDADYVAGPAHLVAVGPNAFTRVGSSGVSTIGGVMQVKLSRAVDVDTVVALASGDTNTLTVPATVTILAGTASVDVPVTGVARNTTPVAITATLNGVMKSGTVRVLDDGTMDRPTLMSLDPATAKVSGFGGATQLTITLDLPALPTTGTDVTVSATNGWTTTPTPKVNVPADQLTAAFTVTQAGGTGAIDSVATATLGAVSKSTDLSLQLWPVINEVDYRVAHTPTTDPDPNEFVEIYNPWPVPVTLDGLTVVFTRVTKTGANPYDFDVPLSKTLASHQYLVVANQAAIDHFKTLPGWTADTQVIANATDGWFFNTEPGAVGILDTASLQIVSAFGYKTPIPASPIKNYSGTFNFAESTAAAASLPTDKNWTDPNDSTSKDGSLIRNPDGQDTGDFTADLAYTQQPTPGSANVLKP
jgi:cysteine-rich repeat protein